MATLAQIRTIIADDYLDRGDLNSQINRAINRAINYYQNKSFWFQQTSKTFNTVSGTKSYDLDTATIDFSSNVLVQATVNGTKYVVAPKTYEFVKGIDSGDYTGYPEYYAIYNRSMFLYPTPNDAYEIEVSYTEKYVDLSLDTDTNAFTENAQDLIECRATWSIYQKIIKDAEQAQSFKAQEMEAFTNLASTNESNMGLDSTPITPTDW